MTPTHLAWLLRALSTTPRLPASLPFVMTEAAGLLEVMGPRGAVVERPAPDGWADLSNTR